MSAKKAVQSEIYLKWKNNIEIELLTCSHAIVIVPVIFNLIIPTFRLSFCYFRRPTETKKAIQRAAAARGAGPAEFESSVLRYRAAYLRSSRLQSFLLYQVNN